MTLFLAFSALIHQGVIECNWAYQLQLELNTFSLKTQYLFCKCQNNKLKLSLKLRLIKAEILTNILMKLNWDPLRHAQNAAESAQTINAEGALKWNFTTISKLYNHSIQ